MLDRPDALVLTSEGALGTDRLAISGLVFRRGSPRPLDSIPASLRDATLASGGEHLVETCWGSYVSCAWQNAGDALDIVRAPLGEHPCYYFAQNGLFVAAADLTLLIAAIDKKPTIDRGSLCRQLAAFDVRTPETCLTGISELPGGHRMTVGSGRVSTVTPLWSPWTTAAPARQIHDPTEAERRVRDAIRMSVTARAGHDHILLKLSGGLDSSIVAACLAQAGVTFDCLNLVTSDPIGDEREYARMVAEALGARLTEHFRDPARIELARSEAAGLPRPTARSFAQESTRLCVEVAADVGATLLFDGGGGDNVFCSLQSARPVVDCLRDEAGRARLWQTASSIAEMVQSSTWRVLYKGWLQSWRRTKPYIWRSDLRFLSTEARAEADGAACHPWFVPPSGALPGKVAHVALVAQTVCVVEDGNRAGTLPLISPLLSQPVVEACLQVPSWLWFAEGLNRATARRAFTAELPESITHRRSKAAPDGFLAEIYEGNRRQIRDMLLGGFLRREKLLDTAAVEAFLADRAPVRGPAYQRILQLADAEAWVTARLS